METAIAFEVTEKQKEICETRARIKNLAMDQFADKKLLRMPHTDIPEIKYRYPWSPEKVWTSKGIAAAGYLTGRTRGRARQITNLHVDLNALRGKENSHAYKEA